MGWKTLQSVDEAARAMLTHRCRYRPGLKLRPEHCDSYRGGKDNPTVAGLSSDALLCHQWQCPGPVPIDYATSTEGTCDIKKQAEAPVAEKVVTQKNGNKQVVQVKRLKGDATCRVCGRKNGDTEFYPTRPDTCIGCIKQKNKDRRAGAVAIAERLLEKQTAHKYVCAKHGPHNGRMIGKVHNDICPECFRLNLVAALKNKRDGITRNSITLPEWMVAWAVEHGAMLGLNANEFVLDKLAPLVEAEWLKEWVLKNRGKTE